MQQTKPEKRFQQPVPVVASMLSLALSFSLLSFSTKEEDTLYYYYYYRERGTGYKI